MLNHEMVLLYEVFSLTHTGGIKLVMQDRWEIPSNTYS